MQNDSGYFVPMEKRILDCVNSFMVDKLLHKAPIDVVILVSTAVRIDVRFIRQHINTFKGINKHFSYRISRVHSGNPESLMGYFLEPTSLLVLVEVEENYKEECAKIIKAVYERAGTKCETILKKTDGKGGFIP